MSASLITALLCAFAVSLIATRCLCSDYLSRLIVDHPNERSLHDRPKPRTGGIAVLAGAGIAWLVSGASALPLLVAMTGLLGIIFLAEDAWGLPPAVRFVAQVIAATAFLLVTGPYAFAFLLPLILVLAWAANLFNFMDGSDGLAAGMTIIGFAAYAAAATLAGQNDIALLSAIVAGAASGFLVWNFQPARIFLGDAGSIPIGFLAAAVGVIGWSRGGWPFWFPALVFAVFILDASVTLGRRIANREAFWRPHRNHYYQRMIRKGWSHRRLALAAYALMAGTAGSAVLARAGHPALIVALLAAWGLAFFWIARRIDDAWTSHNADATSPASAPNASSPAKQ